MKVRVISFLLLPLILLAACGRKEPPKPPPSRVPAPFSDLTVQQRGREILLRMSYPTVTVGGLSIDNLEAIEIWEMKRIIPSFLDTPGEADDEESAAEDEIAGEEKLEEPAPPAEPEGSLFRLPTTTVEEKEESKEALIQVKPREFAQLASRRRSLSGPELDAAVIGDSVLVRVPIEESEEEEILVFGARSIADKRFVSSFSNLVKLAAREAPSAPTSIKVAAGPQGVEISWQGSGEEKGFRIYRRSAETRDYGLPLASAREDAEQFLDTKAQFDQRYIYTVTSISSSAPLVESAITAEYEVDYQDRFPPPVPSEVVALPEPGRVRLLWEPAQTEDAEGYWIFRKDPGQEFQQITPDLVIGSEYLDRDLRSGQTYRYFIVAVDSAGNQSAASEEIEISVP